jgi:hypothetical protein
MAAERGDMTYDSGSGDQPDYGGGGHAEYHPDAAERGGGPLRSRVSRRSFLRTAIAGGGAVIAASLGYWGFGAALARRSPISTGSPAASPAGASHAATPSPTPAPPLTYFRSRPDLSSPLISIATPGFAATAEPIMLTPKSGPGPVIVDNSGAPIWIHPVPSKSAFNLSMGTYKGAPVLSWFEGSLLLGTGRGEYVLVDESYKEVTRVRAANGLVGDLHEFVITPEGTALFTVYVARDIPDATPAVPTPGASARVPQVFDSVVQEVDIESGRLLFEWHAFDHVGLDESYAGVPADHPFDFFHVNSIDVDADGNLLISARSTCAIYKIDRRTGDVIWRLGGKRGDFAMGEGTQFAWQHHARRQPDGTLTLFDDGSNGMNAPTESHSRGLVLRLDESARTATLMREYSHAGPILAKSQGSMQPLPNGNVFVGWGDQPYFTEFTADGRTVFDGLLPAPSTSYRALRFPWHGRPLESPAVATEPADGPATNVYVSWNGATEVAVWVVLGGDSEAALAPLASAPRSGFETLIVVPGSPRVVVARALDASGGILGQSAPVSA